MRDPMIDRDSRYAHAPLRVHRDAEGRESFFIGRRRIPEDPQILAHLRVGEQDRPDLIAHRAYGDPRQFWRILDANPDPEPLALAEKPGRRLKIPQPQSGG